MTHCLVFDLGAGSGRAMVATHDGLRLRLEEVHRFTGYAVDRDDGPHWDFALLLSHVEEGLRRAKACVGRIDSIGVDSWGLDYVLLDDNGTAVVEPHHYRHPRSRRGYDACPLAPELTFSVAGAQALPVNTIFQLYDEARRYPERLKRATCLLMIADAVSFHLTGQRRSELTLARTSGLIDARTESWSPVLCETIGLPPGLLQPIIRPGEIHGILRPELADPLGWEPIPVVAVAAHDTASAEAALSLDDGSGFLVLGSWSLIGTEQAAVRTSPPVREAGFGNEGGVEGRSFLVKSLNGLHLVQKLRDAWARRTGDEITFAELSRLAAHASSSPDVFMIDPADPLFFNPPDIIQAIATDAGRRGVRPPDDAGLLAVAIYKGLADEIGRAASALEPLVGRRLPGFRLCGGGAQDALLGRFVAAAVQRPLRVGPIEASAWGNAIVQLLGLGRIATLAEGRRLVECSADIRDFV